MLHGLKSSKPSWLTIWDLQSDEYSFKYWLCHNLAVWLLHKLSDPYFLLLMGILTLSSYNYLKVKKGNVFESP